MKIIKKFQVILRDPFGYIKINIYNSKKDLNKKLKGYNPDFWDITIYECKVDMEGNIVEAILISKY